MPRRSDLVRNAIGAVLRNRAGLRILHASPRTIITAIALAPDEKFDATMAVFLVVRGDGTSNGDLLHCRDILVVQSGEGRAIIAGRSGMKMLRLETTKSRPSKPAHEPPVA